ncbi:protein arginine kinase [Alkaliphilus transvaalensis]|uniref:protein arginine kinase n=1 Tax=Alkaliphilus transvaalensis TaxID=114628 RepID=UPI0004799B85|nr:protein arginine kinase [Alkaliphilus transvaalensis]
MAKWLRETGPESDIVISSRIRIARNLAETPFPYLLDEQQGEEITNRVYQAIIEGNEGLKNEFQLLLMKKLDKIERLNYIENHLISPDLAKNTTKGSMLINQEETISLLVNEEDHLRIQCLLPGLQLDETYGIADKIDDLIEEKLSYAFDEELGYLTSCPTNLGTGIRASVMMHLPVLNMTGYINGIFQASSQIGITIRGLYGEGTEFLGNIFQISNQVTLGITEEEIIKNLKDVATQIIQKERLLRENLFKDKRIELEDRIFRSYGLLRNARIMTTNEAMKLISDVKLGITLGLLNEVTLEKMNQLIPFIQIGHLQKKYNSELTEAERDFRRAEVIRNML